MPHLLKEYAKNLGVKISKPILKEHFFPIEYDNYITLSVEDGIPSKYYRYYEIVFFILKPFLNKFGIKIIQISGSKKVKGVDKAINLPFKQQAFVISKGLLHLGTDGVINHLASFKKVPTVTLFGNTYANLNKPLFSSSSNNINLEPIWDKKPCFANDDGKQQISNIEPETVAQSIVNLLKKEKVKINFRTLHKGVSFSQSIIEVVPTNFSHLGNLPPNQDIFIRADYGIEEDAFMKYSSNYKCSIFSDKPLSPQILSSQRNNINTLFIFVKPDDRVIPQSYFNDLKRLNINSILVVKEKDDLAKIRNIYFDHNVRHYNAKGKRIENATAQSRFLCTKVLIEGGKKYLSYAHWKKGLDENDLVIDSDDYWRESEYFYIYEQDKDSKKKGIEKNIRT